jgi:hypothetical protein
MNRVPTDPHAKEDVTDGQETLKAYEKPGFRYERVFETMALACSKDPGNSKCGIGGSGTSKLS